MIKLFKNKQIKLLKNKHIKYNQFRYKQLKYIQLLNQNFLYYPLKQYYNSVIPLNIYQTWHTKNLPPLMLQNSQKIKINNPAFNYQLFDDNDCYQFIKENFDLSVLNAYDSLIPGAYKADLWRYCILYINGGIYLDIKYGSKDNFKFINITEQEHFVLDFDNNCIYNALLVCLPKNNILLRAINAIVKNVNKKFYGNNPLDPTGPGLLSTFFSTNEKKNLDMKHIVINSLENRYILYNNYRILQCYTNYLEEINKFKNLEHYTILWENKQIYK